MSKQQDEKGGKHHDDAQQQEQVNTTPPTSTEDSKEGEGHGGESPLPRAYNPERVYTVEQLEVLNVLVHPVWIFDFVQRCLRWANPAALELWNASSVEELQSRDISDMSGSTVKRSEAFMSKAELGQYSIEQWTLYPKGKPTTIQLTVSGLRLSEDEDHKSLLCEGIILVKEELVNETLRSVEMLRHLPMAVCQFDMDGKVMFQNPEAMLCHRKEAKAYHNNNTGIKNQETKVDDAIDVSETTVENHEDHDDNRSTTSNNTASSGGSSSTSAAILQAGNLLNRFVEPDVGKRLLEQIQIQENCEIEAMLRTRDGPRWSAISVRKAKDPVTGKCAILFSARDKSDAIEAQKERKAREQNSEFLAIMAHEIRTPLHQVTGFIDLLDQTSLNKEQKSFIKLLKSSAQGLMTVINDVLDYSKLEAGKMKLECIPYEVRSVVEGSMEAVRASCEEKKLGLTLQWNPTIPFKIKGDPNRLRQILMNLLSNAIKFTKQGWIRVEAMPHEEPVVPISNENEEKAKLNNDANNSTTKNIATTRPMIKFVVSDTGMGIAPENRDVIFRKYQQADASVARNFGGTGLGLSICQLLTHNMGGSIGVESELGKGASFWFCLPAELPTDKDFVESNDDNAVQEMGAKLQVLVVEDNKVNQKLMANMLRCLGHTSALAENGKVAIEMIEKGTYDLVLMDIQMPVMDGYEATRRLRTMGYNNLPIFGLTACVARPDFSELGFDGWLAKPIPMKDLKAKLYQFKPCCAGVSLPENIS